MAPPAPRQASSDAQGVPSTSSRDAINLRTLRRADPSIQAILVSSAYVVLYTYSRGEGRGEGRWKKEGIEGSLFVFERSDEPRHGYLILNRNGMNNFSQHLTARTRLDVQDQFLHLSHEAGGLGRIEGDDEDEVVGLWFHAGNEEAEKVAAVMRQHLDAPASSDQYRSTHTTNEQTTVSHTAGSTQITTSTSTTSSITQPNVPLPAASSDGGLTLPDLLAKLHASSPSPSVPLLPASAAATASASTPSRVRDPPPHMDAPPAEVQISEEERAAMALKYMLGLGPPPPAPTPSRPAATPQRNGQLIAEDDSSSESDSDEEEQIVRHPAAGIKQAQQIARTSSPRTGNASPRPQKAQAAGPSEGNARARTPRLDRASPRPRAAAPAAPGAAARDPKLKDSGYIPNPTLNGGRAGGASAVDKQRMSRAVGDRIEARRAEGQDVDEVQTDAEGRREFVRNLLALIHTDESFVDDLWQRYTHGSGG